MAANKAADVAALPPVFAGRVAVFQPRPGLGDLIWHLPLIRAIAASCPSGRVILVTKPSTQAACLLGGDRAIEDLIWLDRNPRQDSQGHKPGRHDGFLGLLRLAGTLRRCRLDSCVLLHHSPKLAMATALAGIAHRHGYGYGAQRRWLTRPPFLPSPAPFTEAAEQASAFGRALGLSPLPEPSILVPPDWVRSGQTRLARLARPLAILGIGSHGPERQWDPRHFGHLAAALAGRGFTVLLAASGHEAALAGPALQAADDARVRLAVGWPLPDIAACLAEAALFVGNDSGLMNLRAALGRPAYGLFGASGPLAHSHHIRPILPPGGARAGMAALEVGHVLLALQGDGVFETAMTTEPKLDRSSLAVWS